MFHRGGGYTDELILTSHNLVLVKKGALGRTKGIRVFPLQQVRVFQGRAQAIVTKSRGRLPGLEVYLQNGTETFRFITDRGSSDREARFWSEKINEVITGTSSRIASADASLIDRASETVKDTVGAFKEAFGIRTKADIEAAALAAASVPIAGDCTSCGAPVSGIRGQAVICSYCDMATQL